MKINRALINALIDFEKRICITLDVRLPNSRITFLEHVFYGYQNGVLVGMGTPPNIDYYAFYSLSKTERREAIREWYGSIITERYKEAKELSVMHRVPFNLEEEI